MAHGIPTTAELALAVQSFLEDEVMPEVSPRLSFLARVAANVMAQIEREIALGEENVRIHARHIEALGAEDDAELCRAIRAGSLDDRLAELIAVLRQDAVANLCVVNPRWLLDDDRDDR
jgi:hypothetical protein